MSEQRIGQALGAIACRVLNLEGDLGAMKARAETAEKERDEAREANRNIEQAAFETIAKYEQRGDISFVMAFARTLATLHQEQKEKA